MCLILLAYRMHPEYKLVIAANRDEYYARPSLPAGYWTDHPAVLGGRDLEQGGSWMGVTRGGRIAAVTNYRDPASHSPNAKSRGSLVSGYLCGEEDASSYLQEIDRESDQYNGFNLIVGDVDELWYYSNRERRVSPVSPGIHGLSNHLLDTSWPKVKTGKQRLAEILKKPAAEWETALWQLLTDREYPEDTELPSTGVSLEWERELSPVCIVTPYYGTRTNTLIIVDYEDNMRFVERTYHPDQSVWDIREYQLNKVKV